MLNTHTQAVDLAVCGLCWVFTGHEGSSLSMGAFNDASGSPSSGPHPLLLFIVTVIRTDAQLKKKAKE